MAKSRKSKAGLAGSVEDELNKLPKKSKSKSKKKSGPLMESFKSTVFAQSMRLFKEKKMYFLKILLVDIMFVLAILLVAWVFKRIQPKTLEEFMAMAGSPERALALSLGFVILYTLMIMFVYSFFKFLVLGRIRDVQSRPNFGMKGMTNFYMLNLLILFAWVVVFLIIGWLLDYMVNPEYMEGFTKFFAIVAVLVLYLMINIAHFLFEHDTKVWHVFSNAVRILFTKAKVYYGPLVFAVVMYFAYSVFGRLIGLFIKAVFNPRPSVLASSIKYAIPFLILIVVFLYFTISFNRLYFHELFIKQKKL
jgi:hypothetical protein